MSLSIDWSKLYSARNIVKSRFPSIWKIPLVKKEMAVIEKFLRPNLRILEVGAGDRRMGDAIKKNSPSVIYHSFDIDDSLYHDFYNIDSIEGDFDLIFGFELIEHLTPNDGLVMISKLKKHISKDGRLILGTPNLYHPHRYFGDITHITPYKYEELGSLVILGGYDVVGFYRKFNDSFLMRILRLYLLIWLHKFLNIDFATTVFVEAKPSLQD